MYAYTFKTMLVPGRDESFFLPLFARILSTLYCACCFVYNIVYSITGNERCQTKFLSYSVYGKAKPCLHEFLVVLALILKEVKCMKQNFILYSQTSSSKVNVTDIYCSATLAVNTAKEKRM